MKFACDKCDARYAIADEKIRGKVLKIKCKKCGNVLVLREPRASTAAPQQTAQPVRARAAGSGPGLGAEGQRRADVQPGQAAPAPQRPAARQNRSTVPEKVDGLSQVARVPSSGNIAAGQTASGQMASLLASAQARPTTSAEPAPADDWDEEAPTQVADDFELEKILQNAGAKAPPPPPAPSLIWYVAQNGVQSAPMQQHALAARIRVGEISGRDHAWNETMTDWVKISTLPAFAADLATAGAPRAPSGAGAEVVDFQQKLAERRQQQASVTARPQQPQVRQPAPEKPQVGQPKRREPQPVQTRQTSQPQGKADRPPHEAQPGTRPRQSPAITPQRPMQPQRVESQPEPSQPQPEIDRTAQLESPFTFPASSTAADARPRPLPKTREVSVPDEVFGLGAAPLEPLIPSIDTTHPIPMPAELGDFVEPQKSEEFFFDPSSVQSFAPDEPEPDNPFDRVALSSAEIDNIRRDNTRAFVNRAGLKNRKKKHTVYAFAGGGVAVALVAVLGLDAVGVIEIPVFHDYLSQMPWWASEKSAETDTYLAAYEPDPPLTEAELQHIRDVLTGKAKGGAAQAEQIKQRARQRKKKLQDILASRPLDLTGQIAGPTTSDGEMGRKGSGQQVSIELTSDEREVMAQLMENRAQTLAIAMNLKPNVEVRDTSRKEGGLSDEQVNGVVKENQRGLKTCAQQQAKVGEPLPKALTILFTIDTTGRVVRAGIEQPHLQNTEFGRCMKQNAKRWTFPEFTGEPMDVAIPFKFHTVN